MHDTSTTSVLRAAGVQDWLIAALDGTARDRARHLEQVLTTAGTAVALKDAPATCRCHFVALDGNGRPRVQALVEMLVAEVVDYCVPRSRINEAADHYQSTRSASHFVRLNQEARQLFSSIANSGEGGELLLFLLLESLLGLPQILCKMALKTNAEVHFHGVDGVHARALEDGTLALYWGESKLYAKVNAGIDACFKSIAPYLLDTGGGASTRDTMLLRENLDTGDQNLTEALKRYFVATDPASRKVRVRGACLVGFDYEDYGHPLEDDSQTLRAEVAAEIEKWHTRIGTSIVANEIESFEIEVFCLPMPSVAAFRSALGTALGVDVR